jgi:PadR family transcriptional regulator, regulatory protein PadR
MMAALSISRLTIHHPPTYSRDMRSLTIAVRRPKYFVLASMLGGPLHGGAIIERAAAMSDGRVRLPTGTLYTALDRLMAEGLVRTAGEETSGGRTRRSYALTPSGIGALQRDASRAAASAATVSRVVSIGGRARLGGKGRG